MSTQIPLPARVDLQAAISLKDALMAATEPVTLGADKVEMLGAQGLQVMIAGAKHFSGQGGLGIEAPSPGFLNCLAELGADLDVFTQAEPVS